MNKPTTSAELDNKEDNKELHRLIAMIIKQQDQIRQKIQTEQQQHRRLPNRTPNKQLFAAVEQIDNSQEDIKPIDNLIENLT